MAHKRWKRMKMPTRMDFPFSNPPSQKSHLTQNEIFYTLLSLLKTRAHPLNIFSPWQRDGEWHNDDNPATGSSMNVTINSSEKEKKACCENENVEQAISGTTTRQWRGEGYDRNRKNFKTFLPLTRPCSTCHRQRRMEKKVCSLYQTENNINFFACTQEEREDHHRWKQESWKTLKYAPAKTSFTALLSFLSSSAQKHMKTGWKITKTNKNILHTVNRERASDGNSNKKCIFSPASLWLVGGRGHCKLADEERTMSHLTNCSTLMKTHKNTTPTAALLSLFSAPCIILCRVLERLGCCRTVLHIRREEVERCWESEETKSVRLPPIITCGAKQNMNKQRRQERV